LLVNEDQKTGSLLVLNDRVIIQESVVVAKAQI